MKVTRIRKYNGEHLNKQSIKFGNLFLVENVSLNIIFINNILYFAVVTNIQMNYHCH